MFKQKLLIALLLTFLFPQLTYARWVDDWVDQQTTTSPGFFEGQKRGYYTGGSFSARWRNTTDYPVTVELPKIKTGCGGIDIFAGGLSFLDVSYLQEKLQNIMLSAPTVMFDIAFNTLCEVCSNMMTKYEGLINSLNNMQLDDCKASRAVVATIMKPGVSDPAKQEKLGAMQSDFAQSTGMHDLYKEWKNISASNNDRGDSAVTGAMSAQAQSSCPADIREIFGENGLVIDRLAAKFGYSAYADFIRGYVGDVRIEGADEGYKVSYIPPCEGNEKMIESYLNDVGGKAKNVSGTCYDITDANANLMQWVSNRMTNIVSSMNSAAPLSAADEAFLNNIPIPVYPALKNAVGTNQEAAMVDMLSGVTAKAYAWAMMSDLLYRTRDLLLKAQRIWAAQEGASRDAAGNQRPAHECIIQKAEADAPQLIATMIDRIADMGKNLRAEYLKGLKEVNTSITFAERTRSFDKAVKESISAEFGDSVAARMMTGDGG